MSACTYSGESFPSGNPNRRMAERGNLTRTSEADSSKSANIPGASGKKSDATSAGGTARLARRTGVRVGLPLARTMGGIEITGADACASFGPGRVSRGPLDRGTAHIAAINPAAAEAPAHQYRAFPRRA